MNIIRWDTKEILFEKECDSVKELMVEAFEKGISFYRADLKGADLTDITLVNSNFIEADFTGAILYNSNLQDSNFSNAKLVNVDFRYANLSEVDFNSSILRDSFLMVANLKGAKFTRADLTNCDLSYTNLKYASLSKAILKNANLTNAFLEDTWLTDTDITNIKISNVIGNMREIKSMRVDRFKIAWTRTDLSIDSEQYPIDKWEELSGADFLKDRHGIESWWDKWKEIILKTVELSN